MLGGNGNIVQIIDTSGKIVVQYVYDAWGNHKVLDASWQEITDPDHVGNRNLFRYRGYAYNTVTGFYYLKSRFYDPETGRFINMDSVAYADPRIPNGLNLYAYCNNNPIANVDPNGCFWNTIGGWFVSLGNGIESFFDELKIITDNVIESFYFNAGVGWGLGVGVELSPVFSFELMAAQGGGLEILPVPQIGMFEKVLFSLNIIQLINLSYGMDGFTAVGESYDANGQAQIQDVTIGIGASAFVMIGGYWEFGFNISQFINSMGW